MKLVIELEPNEIDSPIRFATAIIEKCMNSNFDNYDYYHYLQEVNGHIDVFLKGFYRKEGENE